MSAPPSMPPQSRFGFDDSELPHPANHRGKSRAAGPHCAAAAEGSFAAVLLTPAQAQVLGDQQRARSGAAKMTQTSKAKHPALPSIPDINRGSTPRDCQSQSPLRAIFRPQLHLFDPYLPNTRMQTYIVACPNTVLTRTSTQAFHVIKTAPGFAV